MPFGNGDTLLTRRHAESSCGVGHKATSLRPDLIELAPLFGFIGDELAA